MLTDNLAHFILFIAFWHLHTPTYRRIIFELSKAKDKSQIFLIVLKDV